MSLTKGKNRTELLKCKRIVIKVGTSSLLYKNGKTNLQFIDHLVRQIVDLKNRGDEVILVTSGAIGIGFPKLGFTRKPGQIPYKQAAAAVGQGILMNLYEHFFHDYGTMAGQLLFTKGDAVNSKHFLYMRNALNALLELGAVPVVNENDAVAVDEIKIGDNDTLSAIVASIANADLLIILSDIDGLYSSDPRKDPHARIIHEVPEFSSKLYDMAGGAGSNVGTGGMFTKIQAAQICTYSGIHMVIAKSTEPEVIERIVSGEEIGSFFKARNVHPELKKRDIIIGTAVKGRILVDEGCCKALLYKGSSLLPVGILGTEGDFGEGDVVSIYCGGREIARGITHYSAEDIGRIKGCHTGDLSEVLGYDAPYDTVIHRDYLWVMK